MAPRATPSTLKSPPHKLIAFFRHHRDEWRERSHKYYRSIRSLRVTNRDLRISRDLWKEKYAQERQKRLELEALLEHPPPGRNRNARPTATATNRHSR
jgi:hypothetical protein